MPSSCSLSEGDFKFHSQLNHVPNILIYAPYMSVRARIPVGYNIHYEARALAIHERRIGDAQALMHHEPSARYPTLFHAWLSHVIN